MYAAPPREHADDGRLQGGREGSAEETIRTGEPGTERTMHGGTSHLLLREIWNQLEGVLLNVQGQGSALTRQRSMDK